MDCKHKTFNLCSSLLVYYCSVRYFLLAQKVIPAGNRKKGTLPNASARKASAHLAGQRGQPTFFLLLCDFLRLIAYRQVFILNLIHSSR
jgi:hypothetical protein